MFSSNATLLTAGEGECVNSTGVSIIQVEQQTDDGAATTTEASSTAPSASATAETADAESAANTIASSYWHEMLLASLVVAGIVYFDVIL